MRNDLEIAGCLASLQNTTTLTITPKAEAEWNDKAFDYEKEAQELRRFLIENLPLGTWRSFLQIDEDGDSMPPRKRTELDIANDDFERIAQLAASDDWLRVMYNTDRQEAAGDVVEKARRLLAEILEIAGG